MFYLQISDKDINALIENEYPANRTTDLNNIYTKVEANISERRVQKRKSMTGEDDCFVAGYKVLRKNIPREGNWRQIY